MCRRRAAGPGRIDGRMAARDERLASDGDAPSAAIAGRGARGRRRFRRARGTFRQDAPPGRGKSHCPLTAPRNERHRHPASAQSRRHDRCAGSPARFGRTLHRPASRREAAMHPARLQIRRREPPPARVTREVMIGWASSDRQLGPRFPRAQAGRQRGGEAPRDTVRLSRRIARMQPMIRTPSSHRMIDLSRNKF
jgi:hypothetical protein